jgi:hypothetical protein
MAQARTRARSLIGAPWSKTTYGSYNSGTNSPQLAETCDDVVGNFSSNNPFYLVRTEKKGGLISGSITTSLGLRKFDNQPTPLYGSGYLAWDAHEAVDSLISKAIARTNPSRAVLSLPVFIGELKDIPHMVRHAGRFLNGSAYKHGNNVISAAKEVASENLAIQFGWAPLINDLIGMAKFAESFERRKRELSRLYSGRGLKRRVNLGGSEYEDTQSGSLKTDQGIFIHSTWTRRRIRKYWAVVRWKPFSDVRYDPDSFEFTKILLGLKAQAFPEALWELLPWSWLIDYFTNVGDLVSLTNNSLQASVTEGVLMKSAYRSINHPPKVWTLHAGDNVGYASINNTVNSNEYKTRHLFTQSDLGINGSFQFLSGRQLSILNSIAMTRV